MDKTAMNFEQLMEKGEECFTSQVYGEAEEYFCLAIKLDPEDSEAHVRYGVVLFQNNKPEESILSFRKATQCDPSYSIAWVNLGDALMMKNPDDVAEAISCIEKAIKLDPECPENWFCLGNALACNNDLKGAINAFDKYIAHSAEDVWWKGFDVKAQLYFEHGDLEKALVMINKAIGWGPHTETDLCSLMETKYEILNALANKK